MKVRKNRLISTKLILMEIQLNNQAIFKKVKLGYKKGSSDNAEIDFPVQVNYFRIYGTHNPKDLIKKGEIFEMTFVNTTDK